MDYERDASRVHIYKLSDSQEIRAHQMDPHGFWYISFKKGQIPEELSGAFTDFEYADRAVKTYLAAKKRVLQKEAV